jgi:hypothetical protein
MTGNDVLSDRVRLDQRVRTVNHDCTEGRETEQEAPSFIGFVDRKPRLRGFTEVGLKLYRKLWT